MKSERVKDTKSCNVSLNICFNCRRLAHFSWQRAPFPFFFSFFFLLESFFVSNLPGFASQTLPLPLSLCHLPSSPPDCSRLPTTSHHGYCALIMDLISFRACIPLSLAQLGWKCPDSLGTRGDHVSSEHTAKDSPPYTPQAGTLGFPLIVGCPSFQSGQHRICLIIGSLKELSVCSCCV